MPVLFRILVSLARLALVVGLALAALLYFLQEKMMYFPRRYPAGLGANLETLTWTAAGGQQRAYLLPPRTGDAGTAPIWVVFGGNGTVALDWLPQFDRPDRASWIVLFEFPGYGRNEGRTSLANTRASLDAFLPALTARFGPLTARLRVAGHSLGAATALEFAVRQPVRQLVLMAPFTSMLEMARRQVGWPMCEVLVERWDNRANLVRIMQAAPAPAVAIVHGADDSLIPPAMGRELASRWGFPFTLVPGAGHDGEIVEAGCAVILR